LRLSPLRSTAATLVGFGVVLILVDALAHVIGFTIQLSLVLLREMAIVLGHVLLLIVFQALFATLEPLRFSWSKVPALHAIGDTVLLVLFSLIDFVDARMTGIDDPWSRTRRIVLLCNRRSHEHQTTDRKDCERLTDCVRHARLNPREEV
jgi:hypothetical protein